MKQVILNNAINAKDINANSYKIIGAALTVHRIIGMGLSPIAYKACLLEELDGLGLHYALDVEIPLFYKSKIVDASVKISLLIENQVMVEIFVADDIYEEDMFRALNHLKQADLKLALLINFNRKQLKGDAIRRVVNGTIE
jgi:GxxExxY protein